MGQENQTEKMISGEERIIVEVNLQGESSQFRVSFDEKPENVIQMCYRQFSMLSERGKTKLFLLNPKTCFYQCIREGEEAVDFRSYIFEKEGSLRLDVKIDPLVIFDENVSMIQHPWIETKNTQFTVKDIQEMTRDEFRYFVFGSRNCSEILRRMFSMCPVPPQLMAPVLEFLHETDQMDLVDKITDIRDIFALNFLLQVQPEMFEKKFSMNFNEIYRKEGYSFLIENLFHQKNCRWSSPFFQKCFDTLLIQAEENINVIKSRDISSIVSSPYLTDSQTHRLLDVVEKMEITQTVEFYDRLLEALERRVRNDYSDNNEEFELTEEVQEAREEMIKKFFQYVDENTQDEDEGEDTDDDISDFSDSDDDSDDDDEKPENLESRMRTAFGSQFDNLKKMVRTSPGMLPMMFSIIEQKVPGFLSNERKKAELYDLFGLTADGEPKIEDDDDDDNPDNNDDDDDDEETKRKKKEEEEEKKKKREEQRKRNRKQLRVIMERLLQRTMIPQPHLGYIKRMIDRFSTESGFFTETEMIRMLSKNTNVEDSKLMLTFPKDTGLVKVLCQERRELSEDAQRMLPEYINQIDEDRNTYYRNNDYYDDLFSSILSNPSVDFDEAVELRIVNFSLELFLENTNNICSCSFELAKKTKNKEVVDLLLSLDVLTKRAIAKRCESLSNNHREQLLLDGNQEVRNITMASHPEVKYQKMIYDQYSQNPNTYDSGFLLSILAQNKLLDKEIMIGMVGIECERDFFFKRELAKRSDLTENLILMLMKCRDIDVYENLSRNKHSGILTPHVIDLVGNFSHRVCGEEELRLFDASLRKIHENATNRQTLNELLSSYQSQFRMNLLNSQSENILETTLRTFLEDADFGVISSIIENIPMINETMLNSIVERKANSQTIRDDLMKQLVGRYINKLENDADENNIPICLFDYSEDVSLYILRELESKNLLFQNIHPALELMIQCYRTSKPVMIQIRSLLLKYLENDTIPGLEGLFLLFLSNICLDIEVVAYCIPLLKNNRLLRCIVKRTDCTGEILWKIYLKQISKPRGYLSPVLLDIASKDSLPEDLKWSLCLLQSKLGKYSIFDITKFDGSQEMEVMKNELFSIFLKGEDNVGVLNENILKYYITFESSSIVPLLHSSHLDNSLMNYFFEKVFPRYSQLVYAPPNVYINKFLMSIRELTGEENIQLHDLKNLNSSTIKKTIKCSRYGVKLGDLCSFIEEIGLGSEISGRIALFKPPFKILFDDDDDDVNTNTNSNNSNNNNGVFSGMYDNSNSKPSEVQAAAVVKVKNFEETRKGLCDLLLSSSIAMLGFIEKFIKEDIFKFSYDADSGRFIEVQEKYHPILDVDEFQVKFNQMLFEHLTTIFSENLLKKKDLTETQFYSLLDSTKYTIQGVLRTLTTLEVIDENQKRVLVMLTSKGIRMDNVSNVTHLVRTFGDESQGLGKFLRGIDLSGRRETEEEEIINNQTETEEEVSGGDQRETVADYLDLESTNEELPPFQQYYRFFECFPFFCNTKFPKRLLNLVKFWGRPDPGTDYSLRFYLNETKKFLDLIELEGPELLKGIIDHSNDMVFKGFQIMYTHHYLEDKKHLCNCLPFERAIKETVYKVTNGLVNKMNRFLKNELEHLVILRLESKLTDVRGKQRSRNEEVLDSLEMYKPEYLMEMYKSMVVLEKEGFSLSEYVSGDLMKFLELIYPFRKIINVRFFRYKNATNQVRNCGFPNIVFKMFEYFSPLISFSSSSSEEEEEEYNMSKFLYHLERAEVVNSILQKITTDSISLSHDDMVKYSTECRWEKDDPLLFSTFLYLSGDPKLIKKQITPILHSQIHTDILKKSEDNLKYLIERCDSCTLLTQPDPEGRIQSIVVYEPVQNGTIALQHPHLLDDNSQCQIDPDNPSQYLRDLSKPKTMLPVEYVEKKIQKIPMMVEMKHRINTEEEFREKVSLIDAKIMIEKLNMTLGDEIERYFKIVITKLNVESLESSIAKFERVIVDGIEVENPQTRKQYLLIPSKENYMTKINQLRRIEKLEDPVKIVENFEYIKSNLLPREMSSLIEVIQVLSREDVIHSPSTNKKKEEEEEGEEEEGKKKEEEEEEEIFDDDREVDKSIVRLSPNDLKAKLFEIGFVIEIMKKEVCYHSLLLSSSKRSQYYLRAVFHHLSTRIYQRLKSIQETKKKGGTILMVFRLSNEGDYLFISSHSERNSKWFNYIHYNNNVCADTDFRKARDFVRTGVFPIKILEGFYLLETVQDLFDEEFVFWFTKRRIERIKARTHHDVIRNIQSDNVGFELGEESGRTIGTVNWTSNKLNHFQKEAALCNASPIVDFKFDEGRECVVLQKDENEMKRELMEIHEKWN